MRIENSVALVTGAGRGLGRTIARELAERGARKIYGGARDPAAITDPGVHPVALDIADPGQVARAAAQCPDVDLLINNAGVMTGSQLIGAPDLAGARQEMQVNYFGTLGMCRAFAPVLAASGGGALVNVLSVVSFFTNPANGTYGASKAAEWAMTNGVRIELARQGTLVVGVHAGYIDTDMAAGIDAPKVSPLDVARQLLDAVEAGQVEVLVGERTRQVKAALSRDQELIYPGIQASWDAARPG
jgi:NAD(P)-dependent dehydrogenase (short-subunit alcohol dehydrogenase family)